MQHIDWDPPKLGSEAALKKQAVIKEEARKQQKQFQMEANTATTRAEALRGRRRVRMEDDAAPMDLDPEEGIEEVVEEIPALRKTPGHISKSRKKKDNQSAKSALVNQLDNMKIPTTFAQLTSISPTYVEELISKLQEKIPGQAQSKLSYIKEVNQAQDPKVQASMVNQEDEEQDYNCFYSCALGYIETWVNGQKVPFLVDSGSMVNIIPQHMVNDLKLEMVKVAIGMRGVGGHSCIISGVVENCNLTIGRFTGPVHLFVEAQAQECILGRPFLFDDNCNLDYPGDGKFLTFQGNIGRRLTVWNYSGGR